MKYEETVRKICGDNWRETEEDERDGGYGVACMMAYLDNSRPGMEEIAKHLGVPPGDIEIAYRRLQTSGVFSTGQNGFNARRDKALNGYCVPNEVRLAWCQVAGYASGFIGQGYFIQRLSNQKPEELTVAVQQKGMVQHVANNH